MALLVCRIPQEDALDGLEIKAYSMLLGYMEKY